MLPTTLSIYMLVWKEILSGSCVQSTEQNFGNVKPLTVLQLHFYHKVEINSKGI